LGWSELSNAREVLQANTISNFRFEISDEKRRERHGSLLARLRMVLLPLARSSEAVMIFACVIFIAIAAVAPALAQDKSVVGDFTKSPTEHIIVQLDEPFVVRSVEGIISEERGPGEPLSSVLFEIQGPGGSRAIERGTTDKSGRFKVAHVAAGTYKFKATLDGFQSVVGEITVTKKAARSNEIKIRMRVGV
jgi:hypothetical protein